MLALVNESDNFEIFIDGLTSSQRATKGILDEEQLLALSIRRCYELIRKEKDQNKV